MKARPFNDNGNCAPEEATYIEINVPGPFPTRILPVQIKGRREGTPNWTWNGDTERPTLRPSILTRYPAVDGMQRVVCHSFVTDGKIQFLGDCTHEYAGQTLPLLEVDP